MTANTCRCGGTAEILKCDGGEAFYVGCKKCPSQIGSEKRGWTKIERAVEWWNCSNPKAEVLPEKPVDE